MIQCPACAGEGFFGGFVAGWEVPLQCGQCQGSGQIPEAQADWFPRGRSHAMERVARDESQMECARRLGVTPREVNDMEHGRTDPARLETEGERK